MSDDSRAFPLQLADEVGTYHLGMTLRDYFAGQVLSGYAPTLALYPPVSMIRDMAAQAYQVADAMLAEREK
jgi:hypothetical protein